jgi:hypothetical protein
MLHCPPAILVNIMAGNTSVMWPEARLLIVIHIKIMQTWSILLHQRENWTLWAESTKYITYNFLSFKATFNLFYKYFEIQKEWVLKALI